MGGSIRSNMGRRNNNRCRSSTVPRSPRKCQRRGPVPAAERKQPILRRPTGVIGTSSYYSVPLFCLCRIAGSLPIKRLPAYRPESDLSGRDERWSSSIRLDETASCRIRLIGQSTMHNAMASAFEDAIPRRPVLRSYETRSGSSRRCEQRHSKKKEPEPLTARARFKTAITALLRCW